MEKGDKNKQSRMEVGQGDKVTTYKDFQSIPNLGAYGNIWGALKTLNPGPHARGSDLIALG